MPHTQTPSVSHHRYQSGVVVIWSETADTLSLCECLSQADEKEPIALAIIWFSATRHSAHTIVETLSKYPSGFPYAGCSTSGEVTPNGMQEHGFIAICLPQRWFTASVLTFADISKTGMETIASKTTQARHQFLQKLDPSTHPSQCFALNLIDGLSYSEETVTLAIDRGLDGIPLIGGSAGDDQRFVRTWQISNGQVLTGGCVLSLVHCKLPCQVFTNNNFVPTNHKLVVTAADPDRRRVSEFNALPAAVAYASAIGMHPSDLDSGSFASHSLVVRYGGEHYSRSIQQLNDDQSFTFFCAIDKGLVLTVARSQGMVSSSRGAIETLEKQLGTIDLIIGFDCIYRKLDAQYRQTTQRISSLYQEKHFVGCNTYGEQFNSMHINQTFTGIAFGIPDISPTVSDNDQ